jgi:hypothetical protein
MYSDRLRHMYLEYYFQIQMGHSARRPSTPRNISIPTHHLTSLRHQYVTLKSQRSTNFQLNILIGFSQQNTY